MSARAVPLQGVWSTVLYGSLRVAEVCIAYGSMLGRDQGGHLSVCLVMKRFIRSVNDECRFIVLHT